MKEDLTQGPVIKTMLRFAVPMIFGNLLQQCYNIADTLIVGRFLGAGALAAVGSAFSLMTFLTSILLGLAMGRPVVVTEIRPETGEVVIGEADDVFRTTLRADRLNWMSVPDIEEEARFLAKIRYNHSGSMCTVRKIEEDLVECTFDEPVRAVTPGQAVVFYDGDYVAGGGTIL